MVTNWEIFWMLLIVVPAFVVLAIWIHGCLTMGDDDGF